MLDLKYVLANVEAVKQNCRDRNVSADIVAEVDRVVALETTRRDLLQRVEEARRRQNEVAQATGKEKDPHKRGEMIVEGKRLRAESGEGEEKLKAIEAELKQRLGRIPNLTHPDAPIGATEDLSRELRKVGTPRAFDFKPKDHVEIGKALDLIDFEAGGKVAGTGFYFLKNDAVLLEMALQQFAIGKLAKRGFIPIVTPDLARNSILEGIGFTPRGAETQIYSVEQTDLSLIGTAEITLGGMHADDVLDEARLPLKYVGLSHCFRTEAGAAGRASRGLYRVHQFTKVEMFAYATPETSGAIHRELLALEKNLHRAGHPLPGTRHLLGRPGRPRLPQVRPRSLDARPGRSRRIRRSHQHVRLHRLPVPPAQHPLQADRPERHPLRPHPERDRRRPEPGHDRRPGKLPESRRPGRCPGSAQAVSWQGNFWGEGMNRKEVARAKD